MLLPNREFARLTATGGVYFFDSYSVVVLTFMERGLSDCEQNIFVFSGRRRMEGG
jgi:hypothetical protein